MSFQIYVVHDTFEPFFVIIRYANHIILQFFSVLFFLHGYLFRFFFFLLLFEHEKHKILLNGNVANGNDDDCDDKYDMNLS